VNEANGSVVNLTGVA